MTQPRIVSLLPSATEIVCALGFQDQLVGRSNECDFPAGVESLPALTEPRFAATPDGAEIDPRVRELAQAARDANAADALGVYAIDTKLLRELRPTHIVTQTQCEVCAVSLRDVERAVAALIDGNQYVNRPGPRVVKTLEIIAEILHSGRFDFGRRGRAGESEGAAEA